MSDQAIKLAHVLVDAQIHPLLGMTPQQSDMVVYELATAVLALQAERDAALAECEKLRAALSRILAMHEARGFLASREGLEAELRALAEGK